jgi:hypothetical protein
MTVVAQEVTPSMLACEGKYSNYDSKIIEISVTSGRARLDRSAVYLSGFPGFNGPDEDRYEYRKIDGGSISFEHSSDKRFYGSINRLTGEFFFAMQEDRSSKKVNQVAFGICRVKDRLF